MRLVFISVAAALLAGAWYAPGPGRHRRVAVTVDDLPVAGLLSGGKTHGEAVRGVSRALLETFHEYGIPAAGFVNEYRDDGDSALVRDVLKMWLDAGMELGNHTYSHLDGNRFPLEQYTADIAKGEPLVKEALKAHGRVLRYFRHPFLHTGASEAVKRGMADYLRQRGYEVAPVTFDNQEWVFARAYERAFGNGDRRAMKRLAAAYVNYMDDNFAFFEQRSRDVLGREPAQVLLIHCNRLNADHFNEVAGRLRRRGYQFTTLAEALRDEAYRIEDPYIGPKGLSWIHRWSLAKGMTVVEEPREPEWVTRMMAGN